MLGGQAHLNDGFGHMVEGEEEDLVVEEAQVSDTALNKEKISELEKQLSEANAARQQQLQEIVQLKSQSVDPEKDCPPSLKVNLNKSVQVTISANNFEYDGENYVLKVIDAAVLDKELEEHCTAFNDRNKKLEQMRNKVLNTVKGVERRRRGLSVSSVRSVNSGVGVKRPPSDTDDGNKEPSSQKPRLSQLPTKT